MSPLQFQQIKKIRVYEQVIEQIIRSVEEGRIKPGERLPSERELAVQLSISRSVVREAMSVLNTSGVIEIRPGIGVFLLEDEVQQLVVRMNRLLNRDQIDLIALLEVRQGLEGQAAYLAAQRANPEDIERIHEAYGRLQRAVYNQSIAAAEDFQFHDAVVRASKNEIIAEMLRMLSDRLLKGLEQSRSKSLRLPDRELEVLQEHWQIFLSIQAGDPEAARQNMLNHLENVKAAYTSNGINRKEE
jgi:GntR family transcriptional repressor for pyruvate dehydrogenase complex